MCRAHPHHFWVGSFSLHTLHNITNLFLILVCTEYTDLPLSHPICGGRLPKPPWIKQLCQKGGQSADKGAQLCCVILHIHASQEPPSLVLYSHSAGFSMPRSPRCFTVKALNVSVVLTDYTDMWKMRGGCERRGNADSYSFGGIALYKFITLRADQLNTHNSPVRYEEAVNEDGSPSSCLWDAIWGVVRIYKQSCLHFNRQRGA